MIRASVTVLTLNNASTIRQCLASLADFSEVIVMDGNSVDGTVEIARSFPNVKVFSQSETLEQNVRVTNFGAMRQRSYDLATDDWVMWVDSDNYLSREAIERIKQIVEENNTTVAHLFRRKIILDDKIIEYAHFYPEYVLCLSTKSSGVKWDTGKLVHEHLVIPPDARKVYHDEIIYSHWPDYQKMMAKNNWYLELAMRKFLAHPEKLNFISYCRFLFKNTARALKLFLKTIWLRLRYGQKTLPWKYSMIFVMYHLKLVWNKRKIMKLVSKYIKSSPRSGTP